MEIYSEAQQLEMIDEAKLSVAEFLKQYAPDKVDVPQKGEEEDVTLKKLNGIIKHMMQAGCTTVKELRKRTHNFTRFKPTELEDSTPYSWQLQIMWPIQRQPYIPAVISAACIAYLEKNPQMATPVAVDNGVDSPAPVQDPRVAYAQELLGFLTNFLARMAQDDLCNLTDDPAQLEETVIQILHTARGNASEILQAEGMAVTKSRQGR